MNLLLDTQALIWWAMGNRRLGKRAHATIAREAASVRVSAASAWEVAIKSEKGRLSLRDPVSAWLPSIIETSGFVVLPVTLDHAVALATLPSHHGDPFDRLLIAQALVENLTLVTSDSAFDDYAVTVLDARR